MANDYTLWNLVLSLAMVLDLILSVGTVCPNKARRRARRCFAVAGPFETMCVPCVAHQGVPVLELLVLFESTHDHPPPPPFLLDTRAEDDPTKA